MVNDQNPVGAIQNTLCPGAENLTQSFTEKVYFLIKEEKKKKKTQDVLLQCAPGIGGVQTLVIVGGGTALCQALPP